jgi:hypothetical protein
MSADAAASIGECDRFPASARRGEQGSGLLYWIKVARAAMLLKGGAKITRLMTGAAVFTRTDPTFWPTVIQIES